MNFSKLGSPSSPPGGRDDDRDAYQPRRGFTLEGWAFVLLVALGGLLFLANWLLWHRH